MLTRLTASRADAESLPRTILLDNRFNVFIPTGNDILDTKQRAVVSDNNAEHGGFPHVLSRW